jgi:hypothetical protein
MISEEAHYLIKWKGYDTSESTWEPKSNLLNCVRTLQQFEKGPRIFEETRSHHTQKRVEIRSF